MPSRARSPLTWFPVDAPEWEELAHECSLEQEGALFRACRRAWRHAVPCTIGDDTQSMENLLGTRRRALEPFLRTVFVPDPDQPGRLVYPRLRTLYDQQRARYEANQAKGAKGGRPAGTGKPEAKANGKPKGNPAETSTSRGLSQSSRSKRVYDPESHDSGSVDPAADAAPARAGPGGPLADASAADEQGADAPGAEPAGEPVDWRSLLGMLPDGARHANGLTRVGGLLVEHVPRDTDLEARRARFKRELLGSDEPPSLPGVPPIPPPGADPDASTYARNGHPAPVTDRDPDSGRESGPGGEA